MPPIADHGVRQFLMVFLLATLPAAMAQERPFRESVSINVDPDAAKSLRMIRDQWENGPDAATVSALVDLCETRGDALVLQDRGVAGGVARFVRVQSAKRLAALGAAAPEMTEIPRRREEPAE